MNRVQRTVMLIAIAIIAPTGCAGPKIPPGIGSSEGGDPSQVVCIYGQLSGKTVELANEGGDEALIVLRHPKPDAGSSVQAY